MKLTGYKRRLVDNGGADRYGQFRDGKQTSPDSILGRRIWHEWKSIAPNPSLVSHSTTH